MKKSGEKKYFLYLLLIILFLIILISSIGMVLGVDCNYKQSCSNQRLDFQCQYGCPTTISPYSIPDLNSPLLNNVLLKLCNCECSTDIGIKLNCQASDDENFYVEPGKEYNYEISINSFVGDTCIITFPDGTTQTVNIEKGKIFQKFGTLTLTQPSQLSVNCEKDSTCIKDNSGGNLNSIKDFFSFNWLFNKNSEANLFSMTGNIVNGNEPQQADNCKKSKEISVCVSKNMNPASGPREPPPSPIPPPTKDSDDCMSLIKTAEVDLNNMFSDNPSLSSAYKDLYNLFLPGNDGTEIDFGTRPAPWPLNSLPLRWFVDQGGIQKLRKTISGETLDNLEKNQRYLPGISVYSYIKTDNNDDRLNVNQKYICPLSLSGKVADRPALMNVRVITFKDESFLIFTPADADCFGFPKGNRWVYWGRFSPPALPSQDSSDYDAKSIIKKTIESNILTIDDSLSLDKNPGFFISKFLIPGLTGVQEYSKGNAESAGISILIDALTFGKGAVIRSVIPGAAGKVVVKTTERTILAGAAGARGYEIYKDGYNPQASDLIFLIIAGGKIRSYVRNIHDSGCVNLVCHIDNVKIPFPTSFEDNFKKTFTGGGFSKIPENTFLFSTKVEMPSLTGVIEGGTLKVNFFVGNPNEGGFVHVIYRHMSAGAEHLASLSEGKAGLFLEKATDSSGNSIYVMMRPKDIAGKMETALASGSGVLSPPRPETPNNLKLTFNEENIYIVLEKTDNPCSVNFVTAVPLKKPDGITGSQWSKITDGNYIRKEISIKGEARTQIIPR